MLIQLTTRFNRKAVQARSKQLKTDKLTASEIERAAMNIGLGILEVQTITYDKDVFEKYIKDNQES